jgi:hypothetical protein
MHHQKTRLARAEQGGGSQPKAKFQANYKPYLSEAEFEQGLAEKKLFRVFGCLPQFQY